MSIVFLQRFFISPTFPAALRWRLFCSYRMHECRYPAWWRAGCDRGCPPLLPRPRRPRSSDWRHPPRCRRCSGIRHLPRCPCPPVPHSYHWRGALRWAAFHLSADREEQRTGCQWCDLFHLYFLLFVLAVQTTTTQLRTSQWKEATAKPREHEEGGTQCVPPSSHKVQ